MRRKTNNKQLLTLENKSIKIDSRLGARPTDFKVKLLFSIKKKNRLVLIENFDLKDTSR